MLYSYEQRVDLRQDKPPLTNECGEKPASKHKVTQYMKEMAQM